MSAHESIERADHVEHAGHANKGIALFIAVVALFLAFSETLGKSAQTESIAKNVEAANLWSFFQAKTIRRTVVQTAAEEATATIGMLDDDETGKAAISHQVDAWQKTASRYRNEPQTGEGSEQLAARARKAERQRDQAMSRYHNFEMASAAFQIAIVLASAAIVSGMRALLWFSRLLGVVGILLAALGLLAPDFLHHVLVLLTVEPGTHP